MYIVFEGIVGSGKSTQVKLLRDFLQNRFPQKEIIITKEPGGCVISDELRTLAQSEKFNKNLDIITETYLFASSRAQSLREIVKPTLSNGGIVISDRSYLSSLAIQGFGRGLGYEKVWEINKHAVDGFTPDIIFFMKIKLEDGLKRCFDHSEDKFESLGIDFYQKVENGYEYLQKQDLWNSRWLEIDASLNTDGVSKLIQQKIIEKYEK
jgi:dTMP kinase